MAEPLPKIQRRLANLGAGSLLTGSISGFLMFGFAIQAGLSERLAMALALIILVAGIVPFIWAIRATDRAIAKAMTVRKATAILFQRYAAMLHGVTDATPPPDPKAGTDNLRWMCRTALENIDAFPEDKLSRWLGFVQGALVMRGLATVNGERDFSRPLFHEAYANMGIKPPPSQG